MNFCSLKYVDIIDWKSWVKLSDRVYIKTESKNS